MTCITLSSDYLKLDRGPIPYTKVALKEEIRRRCSDSHMAKASMSQRQSSTSNSKDGVPQMEVSAECQENSPCRAETGPEGPRGMRQRRRVTLPKVPYLASYYQTILQNVKIWNYVDDKFTSAYRFCKSNFILTTLSIVLYFAFFVHINISHFSINFKFLHFFENLMLKCMKFFVWTQW